MGGCTAQEDVKWLSLFSQEAQHLLYLLLEGLWENHLHLKAIRTAQVLGVRNSAFMGEKALPFSGTFNLAPSGRALQKAAKDVWFRQLLLMT